MARLAPATLGKKPNGAPEKAARFVYTLVWGFARIFSVVALALTWEILARSGTFTPFQLPALSAVIDRISAKGVLHHNAAARHKRRLAHAIKEMR